MTVQPVDTMGNQSQAASRDTQSPSCPKYPTKVYNANELNKACGQAIYFPGQDPNDPNLSYLMVRPEGRLGNILFILSAVLGIAHAQNRAVCFSSIEFPDLKLKGAMGIGWKRK